MLGSALLGQKEICRRPTAALERLRGDEKAREVNSEIGRNEQACLPEAFDGLIELYTTTNKPDEVKKWQAERAEVSQTQADGEEMNPAQYNLGRR